MRVQLAIDGTEVSLGRNDALQHGASEGDVKYVSRRQVVLKAEGGHFDDAGRLLILQLVAESLAGLAGGAGGRRRI